MRKEENGFLLKSDLSVLWLGLQEDEDLKIKYYLKMFFIKRQIRQYKFIEKLFKNRP